MQMLLPSVGSLDDTKASLYSDGQHPELDVRIYINFRLGSNNGDNVLLI